MIKKIFTFLILILILCFPRYSFAATWNCKIKNQTPDFLKKYVENSRKLISNITNNAKSTKIPNNSVPWILNFNIKTKQFFDEISFKIDFLKTYELPKPVKRDINYLEKEIKNMHRYVENLELNNKSESIVKNICDWIENCNIDTENNQITAWEAVAETINNLVKMKILLEYTIQGKQLKFNKDLTLWNLPEIRKQFYENYNNSIKNCSEEEGWIMYNIKKMIWKISTNDKIANTWMSEWEEAIMLSKWLLLWKEKKEYEKKERKLLREELSKKWISADLSESIENNLDDYNWNWQPTTTSNFITNTFKNTKNTIANRLNWFNQSVDQLMSKSEEVSTKEEDKSIPITKIEETKEKVDSSEITRILILEKYKKQIPLTQVQDLEIDKSLNKIISMHIKLWQTINTLNKICPISVKICNSQAYWKWDCWDCY